MIFKSYLLENNIQQILELNMFLFYGENEGLKNEIINNLKIKNKIIFSQEDLMNNEELFLNEIYNKSLFEDKKIIIIDNADDKIFKLIEPLENLNDVKIFIFAQTLSKKSKIRNLFEKSKDYGICACYDDSEVTLKKITFEKLKNIKGINQTIINYIIQQCGMNRYKLNNEIEKIKTYFHDKEILYEKLEELLNVRTNRF